MPTNDDTVDILENEFQPLLANDGVTCTIDHEKVENRKQNFDVITDQLQSTSNEDNTHILGFTYGETIAHQLLDFILKEQQCCSFFDFDLHFNKQKGSIEFHISSNQVSPDNLGKIIDKMIKA